MKSKTTQPKNNNSVFAIQPYCVAGIWKFDDETKGLKAEPFVGETNVVIDFLLRKRNIDRRKPFTVLFSETRLPDFDLCAEKISQPEGCGTWYTPVGLKIPAGGPTQFWLCPALNLYFPKSPDKFFVKVQQ